MSLLPNLRSRVKTAFREHAAEWRPGGQAPAAPSYREADAAFAADPEPAAESTSHRPPRHGAAAWPPPGPTAPRDEEAAEGGSRAALMARLRSPDALREAFVVKEILDRPVGLRPPRGLGIRG